MRALFPLLAIAMLTGCATSAPPELVSVVYGVDEYGVVVVTVNGKTIQQSDKQRAAQVQLIVDTYCPAKPAI